MTFHPLPPQVLFHKEKARKTLGENDRHENNFVLKKALQCYCLIMEPFLIVFLEHVFSLTL